jgi:hypothetical protein
MTQIESLRVYIDSDPEHPNYLLFTVPSADTGETQVGVIYCDPSADSLDDHCAQCRDEILPFGFRGPSEEIPKCLVVSVGEQKFARIKAGWRDSNGLNLNRVTFAP